MGIDPTPPHCRAKLWREYIRPRYFEHGVSSYWLDETDGEGTGGGGLGVGGGGRRGKAIASMFSCNIDDELD